jgi:hypothetical protein
MLAAMGLTLLDWRRQVTRLYADVRSAPTPSEGHQLWRAGRDRLFAEHPDSPLEPADRADFAGLPVAAYDPALRFDVDLDTDVEHTRWEVTTDGDGVVPFTRPGPGHLRRRPLPARYRQGRGPRRERLGGQPRAGPELRVQPFLRLLPRLDLPARPRG